MYYLILSLLSHSERRLIFGYKVTNFAVILSKICFLFLDLTDVFYFI